MELTHPFLSGEAVAPVPPNFSPHPHPASLPPCLPPFPRGLPWDLSRGGEGLTRGAGQWLWGRWAARPGHAPPSTGRHL